MGTALEMKNIVKEFPGVKALRNVTFGALAGEVHGLVGENGAGKSTLMKVLSGVYPFPTYDGDIIVKEKLVKFSGTKDAERAGIVIIHQELNLISELSIAENIFLGREPVRAPFNIIDKKKMNADAEALLKRLNMSINPSTLVKDLSVGKQQMVEIAKAISVNAEVIVLDEPTSALTETEVNSLFEIVRDLKSRNVCMIYISHKLDEIFAICDRITVLRDGETAGTYPVSELDEKKLVACMVGRDLTNLYPPRKATIGGEAIRVENYSVNHPFLPGEKVVDNVSFSARKGEVLGFCGLMGSGRSELVTAIFGAFPKHTTGRMTLEGKPASPKSPQAAIKEGIGLVTEDRKRFGLVLSMSVGENVTMASLENVSTAQLINLGAEKAVVEKSIKELNIKTPSGRAVVKTLSGGNQQKVVLAKWLANSPRILIIDEPTRGVDVGARYEIYSIINQLAEKGVCVIMVSSDLPEALGMSDRILVMREGKITGEFMIADATQEKIMACATGAANNYQPFSTAK